MIRKLAWCLLVLSIIGLIAGALELQLPTLRWPFNVGREMGMETLRTPDLTKITTQELTEAAKDWHMIYDQIPSVTDKASVILKIEAFERVA